MKINRALLTWLLVTSLLALAGSNHLQAAPVNGARVTYATKDVRLRANTNAPARVSAGDILSAGLTIDNGAKARSELTFGNRTVVRLGADTILHLKNELGAMELKQGAILFQIPRTASAGITTGPVHVTSKNAIGLIERNGDLYIKLLLLGGDARVSLPDRLGESIVMKPGEVLITSPKATALPETVYFDIARAVRTCRLINDFPPLLGQEAIADEARKQASLTNKGTYIPSNLVIFGRGTLVNLVPPESLDANTKKPPPNPQTAH